MAQWDADDPDLQPLYAKARAEHAMLVAYGALTVPFMLTLVFHDDFYIEARSMAIALGVFMLIAPALSLKGWAADRPQAGIGLSVGGSVLGAYVGTGTLWMPLLAGAMALSGTLAFYRIRTNTAYKPRLLASAVEKARAEAAAAKLAALSRAVDDLAAGPRPPEGDTR